ncbi:MAG: AI-2E family transporter, partial [Actinomyces sp.]
MSDTCAPARGYESATTGRLQGESIAITIATLVISGVGVYCARDLIGPAFFALTLVITVRPLVSLASRHHVPRPVSAIGAILLIYAFVLAMFAALGVAVIQLIDTLPDYTAKFQTIWHNSQTLLERFGVDWSSLFDQISKAVDTSRIVMVAQGLLSQISSLGSILSVMALTVIFLMFDMSRIEARARALTIRKPGIAAPLAD